MNRTGFIKKQFGHENPEGENNRHNDSSSPTTAQAQYDATQHLPLSQAKAGDLVFFHSTYNAGSYVTHVGILVSPTQMYHAGNPIGYADLSSSYWQQHLIGAGRVKQ